MYFAGLGTVEDVKRRYRDLAKAHHPDVGGDTATMQAINAAYHAALGALDGFESVGTDGKTHRYRYDHEQEQAVMDKIGELLGVLPASVDVLLIGSWVWVQGTKREDVETRTALKKAGCAWHSKRGLWYWRQAASRHYGRQSRGGLETLAWKYGYKGFNGRREDERTGTAALVRVA